MSTRDDPPTESWERWQFGSTDLQDEAAGLPVPHRTLLRIELGLIILIAIAFYAQWVSTLIMVLFPATVILGVAGMLLDWGLRVWWAWLGCTLAPIVATGLFLWSIFSAMEGG